MMLSRFMRDNRIRVKRVPSVYVLLYKLVFVRG